ncbi:MAG: hypothetical protein AAF590_12195 [Pseudomonadota bacterium]
MRGSKPLISAIGQTVFESQFEHGSFVFEAVGFPKFPRACEEYEGEFEHFLEASVRCSRFGKLSSLDELILFKPGDTALISGDGCIALRIDNAVHQFLDFLVELEDIAAQGFLDLLYLR